MKIRTVHIENFRGIDRLDLDFINPLTKEPLDFVVLAGPNGCGKSSVLQAITTAFDDEKWWTNLTTQDSRNLRYGTLSYEICVRDDTAQTFSIKEVPAEKFKERKTGKRQPRVKYFTSWREPKLVGALSVNAGKKGKRPVDNEENRLWLLKQRLINLTAMKGFEPGAASEQEEQKALEKLNSVWRCFYPQGNEKFVTRRSTISRKPDEVLFDLFLSSENPRKLVPVDDLSSGEIEVLTLLGSLTAMQDEALDIVLIDEPELHLHPSWHRSMIRALRAFLPDTQIICTTHSLEVLEEVCSYERFILLREDDPRTKAWKLYPEDSPAAREVAEGAP